MSAHILDSLHRAPDAAPAVGDDAATLSYGELRHQAMRLAGGLHTAFGSGRYLLLPARRDVDFVRCLCAVSYSGNIPVPVDPDAPAPALEALRLGCADDAVLLSDQSMPSPADPIDLRDADIAALVLFTSGTSGEPKGVVMSHANLRHSTRAISAYLDYAQNASAALVLPLHYSYALLSQLLCMLSVGGFTRIFASFRNPLKFAETVNELDLATFCGVPSTYQALCMLRRMAPFEMPRVRILCSAGAAMDRSLLAEIRELFPAARFFDNYGMTEATPRATFIEDSDPRFDEATCGRPIEGLELRVLDEQDLRPLPDGETGVVALRGPNIFAGYLNDAAATAAAFSPDGFLLSGDLGYLNDGYLYVRGRRDEVFNVGGEKVSPLEIEHALNEHPAIDACGVAGIEDGARGRVATAFLRLASPVRRVELAGFLADRLPPSRMPVRYYAVDALPLTGNGKLQRARLLPDNPDLGARDLA